MFDNQVIINDHVTMMLALVVHLACIVIVVSMAVTSLKRTAKARVALVDEADEDNLIGLHDEEPDDGSLIDKLRPRSVADFVIGLGLFFLFAWSVFGLTVAISHVTKYGITEKSIDEEIAVRNIEEKYNLTAVELVDDSTATNENQTRLMTDSPEFVGIYNGNTVVHFVVAFQENSGEPSIAVIPPSDGITATQIERATSRNAPDANGESGEDDDEQEADVIEAASR